MAGSFGRALGTAALVSLVAAPALAEKASQLTSINGSLGRDAESMLQSRGFTHVSTHKNDMGYVYSYWWKSADKSCVSVEVYNGRVETVSDASASDCGHGGGSAAAAAGVVAGAAILGALLSHKSHHHDNDQHAADVAAEQQYERGYTDGLHNAAYHNYERTDAYSSGYQAGVDERNANLSHHSGRGGYSAFVKVDDLNGARAAGGMEELTRRGFTQVDNFTSGNARYSIQYRAASRQCVQATVADGRLEDVRDIGTHPKCR
ncbi:hypothetical protein A6F68_01264 [Tsuneonella dongtanensis]|uniref:PepSY domain-containing protein n=1 Tax=Tsuneonella dongtanensis TaxID=692370 RepID=A0A1B2ACF4_9SPHN|nr:hypothetical protein [Tsuneonella dongtanensis]ANY19781.1 hypothetical protein A6F68_01264 [Tsuneonella dongtanensis]